MLRECRRVLEPGGRLAVLTIETAPRLAARELALAAELGPSAVRASAPVDVLAEQKGFEVLSRTDVTVEFAGTVEAMTEALLADQETLLKEEGSEAFVEELHKKQRMAEGIERGLLRRTVVIARNP